MDFQKNQLFEVTIEDMSNDGEGIGKVNGYPLFVKDTVIGDRARVRLTKVKKNYAFARLEELLEASADRTEPGCAFHKQCGGCQIQAMDYAAQLCFKEKKVRNHLMRIGGFSEELLDSVMEPIVGMEEPWHYRNKAQFPIGTDREGNPVAGFYAGRTHYIIPNTDCGLGVPENKEILERVLSYMKENHVPAYDEATGKGLLRHVLIRKGFSSGQLMVCLVATKQQLPNLSGLIDSLTQVEGMTSISVNINADNTNVILGKKTILLWGKETIEDTIQILDCSEEVEGKIQFRESGQGVTFMISAQSFYQVNPEQTKKLYSLALQYANLTGKETVWDLYCGIGTISLFLAKHAGCVYGVEIVPQAIADAKENARINGITNAAFVTGKAEEVLPAFYRGDADIREQLRTADDPAGKASYGDMTHPDVIVVDPPRKGCDQACLDTMLSMAPDRIVYVSCDSATLARDLRILCDGGYTLQKVRPVDQFAHTVHVETVVLLTRQNT